MQRADAIDEEAASSHLLALQLALEHPALSSSPQVLCAAARSCKAWREAVQQISVCNTDMVLTLTIPNAKQWFSLYLWLRKHGPLVKSMTWLADPKHLVGGYPPSWSYEGITLQTTSAPAAPAAAAAAIEEGAVAASDTCSADTATCLQQQQQRMRHHHYACKRMVSYTTDIFMFPEMLDDLPAHSLTRLEFDFTATVPVKGEGMSAALARLTSLQQLRIASTHYKLRLPGSCLAGLAQLTRLTSLTLEGEWKHVIEPLQQLLQQPLPLQQLQLHMQLPRLQEHVLGFVEGAALCLNMGALTQLQELSCLPELNEASVLPVQLQRLQLGSCRKASSLDVLQDLQQLRELQLTVSFKEHQPLLRLALLPALQHLALEYTGAAAAAAATAGVWPQLPKLFELKLNYAGSATAQQMEVIQAGVAAANGVTKLELQARVLKDVGHEDSMVCASLAGLTQLKDLCIHPWTNSVVHDAVALSCLTGLTRLALPVLLHIPEIATGPIKRRNAAIAALVRSLKHLQHLNLQRCQFSSVECMAALGVLTQLTELRLEGNDGLMQQGLMLLTGLKQLQRLGVDRNAEVTDEAVEQLWAAVRQR